MPLTSAALPTLLLATAVVARAAWVHELPPLPDPHGLAGMFAGGDDATLIAAGGHQFSNGIPWWDGGKKVWSDRIFFFTDATGEWHTAPSRLPRPLGDGASLWYRDELHCAGGGDSESAFADVFAIGLDNGKIRFRALCPLPAPKLRAACALLDEHFVVLGGRDHPTSSVASNEVWALDLRKPERWVRLPDIPGPGRMMSVTAVVGEALYLFGGIEVYASERADGKNRAPYLQDAYRFSFRTKKWTKLPDIPRPLAGSPSPAAVVNRRIYIVGGVDGTIEAVADRSSITELPRDILSFDVETSKWHQAGSLSGTPSRVNAPAISTSDRYLIVGGEHLPARRTNLVSLIKFVGADPATR